MVRGDINSKLGEINRPSYKQFRQEYAKKLEKEKKIFNNYEITGFYHYTHENNIEKINEVGLLSKNLLRENAIDYHDISDVGVQDNRDNQYIGDLNLHDFVPLFFSKVTPMMHSKKDSKEIEETKLIIIKSLIFFTDGVFFTDANAAANQSSFYPNTDISKLENIKWGLIKNRSWRNDDPLIHDDQKQQIGAEILVPYHIPPDWFQEIVNYEDGLRRGFFHRNY